MKATPQQIARYRRLALASNARQETDEVVLDLAAEAIDIFVTTATAKQIQDGIDRLTKAEAKSVQEVEQSIRVRNLLLAYEYDYTYNTAK